MHLVYELHVTSALAVPAALERLEVQTGSGTELAAYERDELAGLIGGHTRVLAPGPRAVVYLWIPFPATTPASIDHRLLAIAGADTLTVSVGSSAIPRTRAATLGPPLRGGPWVAVYAPELERGHRRVLFGKPDERRTIPARFAIDWLRVDSAGRLARGDPQLARNHYAYGAEVLAVADARVVAVRDGISERERRVPVAHGAELASGNYITLELGDGQYVSYEHLKPGSINVQPGERVSRGQVIAQAGFSGDGSHPHLHLHVSNGATPMIGEGLPWQLSAYTSLGSYPDLSAVFAAQPWTGQAAGSRYNELPAPNTVVQFPQ
jgi:hypothetical protein